jgi:hypothetical protein
MTRFGVNIEKTVSFRGATQPFGNTYYYEAAVPAENTAYLNDLLDDLIAIERAAHSTIVTFVKARLWSQLGSPSQNNMLIQRSLSGTGTAASPVTGQDRERAFLVRLRAGVDTRGRPVYLRKWFHLEVGSIGGASISGAQLDQTAQLTTAQQNAVIALMDSVKTLNPGAGPDAVLKAKNGRGFDGSTIAHPWLEHRQLGDIWRGI